MKELDFYINKFVKLHTDTSPKRWSELTCHRAPHKPLLLLSVLDLFAQKAINTNLIEITNDLAELFGSYWSKIMNQGQWGNLALPFFHLQSEKFWHLLPKNGKEEILANFRQIRSISQLIDIVDNGLALCRLCHWSFDEGLMGVSKSLAVLISPRLTFGNNVPGHLQTLAGRGIITPSQDEFLPANEALKWHRNNVFYER